MRKTQIKQLIFIITACFLLSVAVVLAQGRPPAQAGLPDLVITSMKVLNWDNCQVEMNIANIGEVDSGKFSIRIEAFYNNQWQILGLWNYDSIPAGQSASKGAAFTDNQIQIILNSAKLKATIDPNNNLNEKSKSNNTFEIPISLPKADLIIANIQVTDYINGKIMVAISNMGDAASKGAAFKIEGFSDNQWVNLGFYNFPEMQPGQSQNFFITLDEAAKQKLFIATKLKGYIDFYTNVPEKNENNNIFEIALIPPKPDLVITGMKVLNWQNCQTEVDIANMGEMDLGTFNVKLEAFCNNQWQILGTSWPSPAIAPGKTAAIAAGFNDSQIQIILKSTKLRATLDPENKISEKNEGNNTFEIPISPPMADLMITDIKVTNWAQGAVLVTVTNAGNSDAAGSTLKLEVFMGNAWQDLSYNNFSAVPAGQSKSIVIVLDAQQKEKLAASTKIKGYIDFYPAVPEKNENNNTFEVAISPPKADLSITSMKVSEWKFCDLQMNVANTGEVDSGKFEITIEAFCNNQWQSLGGCWTLDSVPAGQSSTKVLGTTAGQRQIILKSTKLKAILDPNNKLTEKNENNNVFEISILPPKADLAVTNIQLNSWEKGMLIVTIANIGEVDSADITLKLEVFSGNKWQELTYNSFAPLPAGQSKSVVMTLEELQKGKLAVSSKIKAHADFYDNVSEKNENNNTLEKNVIVNVNIQ